MNSSPHNSLRCRVSWQEARSWKTSTQLYTGRGTFHFFALHDKSPHTQVITTHYGVISQDKDIRGRPVSSTPVVAVHDTSLLCLTWVHNSHYYQYHYVQLPLTRRSFLEGLSALHCVETHDNRSLQLTRTELSKKVAIIPLEVTWHDSSPDNFDFWPYGTAP